MMNLKWIRMMMVILILGGVLLFLSACSEFALLASGSSLALSQNTYAKVYNGVDVLTIMKTEKRMKKHIYDNAKKTLTEIKEGKEYIYDKTWGITDN